MIWLYWKGDPVWGTVLLVWTIFVGSIDNVVRPLLIRKGVDLPLLVIFTGVIGGLIAFGIVGLFIGPVVLAVTYRLIEAWVAGGEGEPTPDSGDPSKQIQGLPLVACGFLNQRRLRLISFHPKAPIRST